MEILLWICVGYNLSLVVIHASYKRWGMVLAGIGITGLCTFGAYLQGGN